MSMSKLSPIPVLTIDGPSGSGKGAVSLRVAQMLGWHYLDSGALYRALALVARTADIASDDCTNLVRIGETLDIQFKSEKFATEVGIFLNGKNVDEAIRGEDCGDLASKIAVFPPVRTALLQKQRDFRQMPGLVADGRDMGTTVFPDAILKVFLNASAEIRAERRYKQLKEKGFNVTLLRLLGEIRERDRRDAQRTASPLKPAEGAYILDTSTLNIAEVVDQVCACLAERYKTS